MKKVKPIRIAKKTQDAISYLSSNNAILSKIDIILYDLNHTVGDSIKPNQRPKVLIRPKEISVVHSGDGDSIANVSVFH